MKNIVKVTALSLALALSSTAFATDTKADSIAFINAGYLFQNHPDREAVAKKLDEEFKAPAEKLQANKKSIDDQIAALQKDAPRLKAADIKKKEEDINKLMKAHDEEVRKFQAENQKREGEERAKLLESIQTATNNVAKAKAYTYVLDANAVVFAAEGKDITEEVLKAIPKSAK